MTVRASIVCPQCGAVSYHPKDIAEQYCGRCHQFHEFMTGEADRLVSRMTQELAEHAELEIVFQPATLLQLAGLLQLASRHPRVTSGQRATIDRFLAGVRAHFSTCPAVLDVLARGDLPEHDQ